MNQNKIDSMEAVGELPDFGNLLLREGGYPHLPAPTMSQFATKADYEAAMESQSDGWTDASILPTKCKVYETQVILSSHPDYEPTVSYQYFDGYKFNFAAGSADGAWIYRDTPEFLKTIKWREVQP